MRPFRVSSRFLRGVRRVAAGGVAVAVVYTLSQERKNVASASWTTNFKPSVPWDHNWDKRDPGSLVKPTSKSVTELDTGEVVKEKLEQAKATATRHLFLIRHGQYDMSSPHDEHRKLTTLGKTQADKAGKRLKELNHPYTLAIISTMQRAQETGQIICSHLPEVPVKHCSLIQEGAPIPPEPPVGHWKPELKQFHEEGARIEAAFRKYFHRAEPEQIEDSYEILVCHANVIRYFVCRALQFPPEAWLRISLYNGSITWLAIRPTGRVSLKLLGDSGHLAPDELTVN
ncbi:serine/threonine-protein phosphatase PGAM5, mitochondrial-like isoform X1 [Ptychodera flava]|uniref:serine/threonine-protein phosphatase PGAM5, mitochondrial-like isoform X1 n=1 Tax=Ptychodera flava TaxID=63121 RepID=UPI003969C93A